MTSDACPDCGHAWAGHPGASVWVNACVACIYEEDQGARVEADMCSRVPPDAQDAPAGRVLVARYQRRRLRGDGVSVEDRRGQRWALLRPPEATRQQVERLLTEVQEDLRLMPVIRFREKYRPLLK
jgi:hypothetical protein